MNTAKAAEFNTLSASVAMALKMTSGCHVPNLKIAKL